MEGPSSPASSSGSSSSVTSPAPRRNIRKAARPLTRAITGADDLRHPCSVCGEAFQTPQALAGHHNLHSRERRLAVEDSEGGAAIAQRPQAAPPVAPPTIHQPPRAEAVPRYRRRRASYRQGIASRYLNRNVSSPMPYSLVNGRYFEINPRVHQTNMIPQMITAPQVLNNNFPHLNPVRREFGPSETKPAAWDLDLNVRMRESEPQPQKNPVMVGFLPPGYGNPSGGNVSPPLRNTQTAVETALAPPMDRNHVVKDSMHRASTSSGREAKNLGGGVWVQKETRVLGGVKGGEGNGEEVKKRELDLNLHL